MNRRFLAYAFYLFFVILGAESAQAKLFRNAYVSFEMPDNWNCNLEQTEWVCRSDDAAQSKEAIIILTAKEVGPMDSLDAYTQHLNSPQQVTYRNTGTTTSRIVYAPKKNAYNDQTWVDGLHLGSEVPSYFTRYLATIKDKIAVLVTFSAHRNKYDDYSTTFFKAVNSLRVIATSNILNNPGQGPVRPSTESLGHNQLGGHFPDDGGGGGAVIDDGPTTGSPIRLKTILLIVALLLAAGGIYVFMKSKQK